MTEGIANGEVSGMHDEVRRTWDAWRDAVVWPKVAAVAAVLLLIGALFGAGAVHGDTLSRVLLVPAAVGAGLLVVALPRRTMLLRGGAFLVGDYIARFHFATPPPGREDTPPALMLNPLEFFSVHESLVAFILLATVAEAVGSWLLRPRRPAASVPRRQARDSAPGGWSSPKPPERGNRF